MREALPPYDLDAEEATLGSLLIDNDAFIEIEPVIGAEDFFSEQNQFVFGACRNLSQRDEAINQITVAQELIRLGKLDESGGAAYLSHLVSIVPTSLHVKHYAQIVYRLATMRRLISAAGQIESIGYRAEPDINLALSKAEEIIFKLRTKQGQNELITPEKLAFMGADRYATLSHGIKTSIKTGIAQLDYETGGMFQGEMWILGGRASHGKTSLAMQMSENMQTQGNILFASLEMNWRGLLDRRMASEMQVHPRSVRIGNYSDEFYKQIVNTLPKIAGTNLYFLGRGLNAGSGITTDMLFKIADRMKATYGLSAIVVDYLQLLADGGKSPYERISMISTRTKQLLEALEVPGLILSQLSRSVEDQHNKSKRPTLTSFRETGRIEEDADVALLMFRPDKYPELLSEHPELRGTAELILAKNRQGDSDISIPLAWDNDRRIYV